MNYQSSGPWYDRGRRNELIDRYYANRLTLDEARELQRYVQHDVDALRRQGETGDDLFKLLLFLIALGGLLYVLSQK